MHKSKLLSHIHKVAGRSTLLMLKRHHRTVKKADKILYKRKQKKGKEFKGISDRDVQQLRQLW